MPNIEKLKRKKNVKGLIKALKNENKNVRYRAADALAEIKNARSVEPLIEALKDEDKDVRRKAVDALGNIGDSRAVELLIQFLKEEEGFFTRRSAAEALGEIGDSRAVEPLIQFLKEEISLDVKKNTSERRRIENALRKIGEPAVEPLIRALDNENYLVRWSAAEILGRIRDPRAVEPLIHSLKDKVKHVRRVAADALGNIGDPRVVEPLIQAFKDWYDKKFDTVHYPIPHGLEALKKLGDPRAAELIIDWLFQHTQFCEKYYPDFNSFTNIFGKYAYFITKAAGGMRRIGDFRMSWHYFYRYDLKGSNVAISRLLTVDTKISSNILHKIAQKKDISVLRSEDNKGYREYTDLSFESQREMARKELARRGNPPYDPSVYLDREAWQENVLQDYWLL